MDRRDCLLSCVRIGLWHAGKEALGHNRENNEARQSKTKWGSTSCENERDRRFPLCDSPNGKEQQGSPWLPRNPVKGSKFSDPNKIPHSKKYALTQLSPSQIKAYHHSILKFRSHCGNLRTYRTYMYRASMVAQSPREALSVGAMVAGTVLRPEIMPLATAQLRASTA